MVPVPTLTNEYGTAELCAGPWYLLQSNCTFPECLEIQWYATQVPEGSTAAQPASVIFSSPRGVDTYVRVPTAGFYCFGYRAVVEA